MSNVLKDLSIPALIKAIKANRFEWYSYLGRSPNAELRDSPNLTSLLTGVPFPAMNTVMRTHATRNNVDEIIEETVAYFKSKDVIRFTWWDEPGTKPTDLRDHLQAHGFTYDEGPPGMAVDLLALNEDITAPSDLRIKHVSDAGTLKQWISTLVSGFELPTISEVAFFDLFIGLGFDLPLRNYVGFRNEEPIATAELFLGAGVAGIYGVATVPKARRQGIGAALTLAPLREARAMGYRIGILHSSEMGLGLYRHLGFQEYCKMSHYVWTGETSR
ncbi:MAG: GNAT family N-acetyltransferase [Anaerolineales bacterium]|nr:GNAT family N-acetyltransferase [Anaerolineales bacterium]